MHKALTVAGSDSGGGAGIQADLKTFAAMGVYGTSAITAVTAQNTLGVAAVADLSPDMVTAQIDAVMNDIAPQAVKTGMVSSSIIITAIAQALEEHHVANLVVDPVMVATSGDMLLQPEARTALMERLIPLALVVTPNLPEAEVLAGVSIGDYAGMKEAARIIHELGCRGVLVKGGHRIGDSEAVDLLYDGQDFQEFRAPRIDTRNTHGTGCTYSAAIASGLAKGKGLVDAIGEAKEYVTGAIRHGLAVGKGAGPTHHFWRLYEAAHMNLAEGTSHHA